MRHCQLQCHVACSPQIMRAKRHLPILPHQSEQKEQEAFRRDHAAHVMEPEPPWYPGVLFTH